MAAKRARRLAAAMAAAVRAWVAGGAVVAALYMVGRPAKRGRNTTGQLHGGGEPAAGVLAGVAVAGECAEAASGQKPTIAAVDGALGEAAPGAGAAAEGGALHKGGGGAWASGV